MSQESAGQIDREKSPTLWRLRNSPAVRWIGIGITAAALLFFILYIRRNLDSIPPLTWTGETFQTLGASLVLQCLALLGGATAWIVLLRGSGGLIPNGRGLSIYFVGQFGKYVPGNVSQHVGRVALAQSDAIRTIPILIAMSLEVVVSILASLLIVLVLLTASDEPLRLVGQMVPAPGFLGVVALLIVSGLAIGWSIIRFRPGPFRTLLSDDEGKFPSFPFLTGALAIHTSAILLIGAILVLLGSGLYGYTAPYIQVCGVYAFAWVVGYLTPGAPAGLGIREVLLVAGLSPFYGPSAAAIALIHRLIVTGADALMLSVGLILRRGSLERVSAEFQQGEN
jgi:uncharacterized membrane protein YbhN (UPF0104 family)